LARVKFKNTKGLSKRLSKKFTAFTDSEAEMDKAAKTMHAELLLNLRNGIGGDDEILPDLKNSTIKRRGDIARANRTASKYLQYFSNVTLTGKFLQALKVIAVKTPILNRRRFEFFYKGTHPGYKNSDGSPGKTVSNSKIYKGLTEKGWKLTGVTASAQNRIRKQFIRFIRRK
jgi:hypothetical protein